MEVFRSANEAELRSVYEVFYQNELLDNPHLPLPGNIPPYLSHVLQTGTLFVAEKDGKILAFAGAITRGNISFLTDLFVLPSYQSGQLGKTLLRCVLPQDDLIHCTMSSSDPRACTLHSCWDASTVASFRATTGQASSHMVSGSRYGDHRSRFFRSSIGELGRTGLWASAFC